LRWGIRPCGDCTQPGDHGNTLDAEISHNNVKICSMAAGGRSGKCSRVDLDEVADRLYALSPDRFVAERDAAARTAKDAGDAGLARGIGGLRRPTVSAWAVNQVARARPDDLAELLDLGEDLRQAWSEQDAERLTALTGRRGPLRTRLARLVREHAAQA